jgi:hypothetical protein
MYRAKPFQKKDMENQTGRRRVLISVVRWTARILTIVSIGLVLLFIVGEGFNPTKIKPREWLGLLFFPVGISVGMILAWWKEGLGGSITVGSLCMFYMIDFATTNRFPNGWAWFAFAAPGFLFILCWYLMRRTSKSKD